MLFVRLSKLQVLCCDDVCLLDLAPRSMRVHVICLSHRLRLLRISNNTGAERNGCRHDLAKIDHAGHASRGGSSDYEWTIANVQFESRQGDEPTRIKRCAMVR